ncbi:putative Cutinase [Seiridium unicorne]|uniref:Cutinase n=1 Tax=Seiridium unicorne TaxID=138068 RepID=A0ABR2V1M0_9PEZI
MKSIVFLALVAATLASPVSIRPVKRQTVDDTANEFVGDTANEFVGDTTNEFVGDTANEFVGDTANEFVDGGCRDVIFIFSRGSTESGNMGIIIGPEVANGLKSSLGDADVAAQGVDYAAALETNFLPGGADPAGIATMVSLLNQAVSQCPDAKIVIGGYSQGAAMTHRAVEQLDAATVARITGVTLFGDTQYKQTGGVVGSVPANRASLSNQIFAQQTTNHVIQVKIYCAVGDLVCDGTLAITAAHLSYGVDAGDATSFLVSLINAA